MACRYAPELGLVCGERGRGRDAAIGWRQLLLRDCSELGGERAGHVLPPWNWSLGAPETGRDQGMPPSLVRDDVLGKVSVVRGQLGRPSLCTCVREQY